MENNYNFVVANDNIFNLENYEIKKNEIKYISKYNFENKKEIREKYKLIRDDGVFEYE